MTQQVLSTTTFSTTSSAVRSETFILWSTYLLYLLFAPALLGFGVNYLVSKNHAKLSRQLTARNESSDEILSHHQWLMRTFIFVSAFIMAGIGTMYYGVGYVVVPAAIVWWYYRVIKGMIAFANHRCMPV